MFQPEDEYRQIFPEVFMENSRLSFMSGYQAGAVSPLEELNTYTSGKAARRSGNAAPAARGADTVSFSDAALEMSRKTNTAPQIEQTTSSPVKEPDDSSSVPCLISVGGKSTDVAGTLEEIAAEDFGKFMELMKKLKSGDPGSMLDALAEICGSSRAEVQESIENMDEDTLAQFAAGLSKLTGQPISDITQCLRDIQENSEYSAWAEGDSPAEPNSRLAAITPHW